MNFREEWKWLLPLIAVSLLIFANTVGGDFVYDDTRQIVRNILIQDNSMIWKALTSDVWAFKGDGSVVASNYWRPTFTAWHIINFRLFGTNPIGWHVMNLVLHTGICAVVFGLLRRWQFSAITAFAIALIFSVHPSHTESVAWISGSPDLLFSLAFLGSLWFTDSYAERRRSKFLIIAVILYAIALGAKEIGIVCLPIYYFVLSRNAAASRDHSGLRVPLIIFASTAAVYFVLRWILLGAVSRPPEDAVRLGEALLSIPEMFAFYLRQAVFPYLISGNYPLTPVSQIGVINFALPLAVSTAAMAGIWYLSKNNNKARLAAAIFLMPLIPALNATAFKPEEIVHDRYLYLPLLGILTLIVLLASKYLKEKHILAASVVIAIVLSIQTITYNKAWSNEASLWSWNKKYDDSAFTSLQYANTLSDAGRYDDAIREFTYSIDKRPRAYAFLGRGRTFLKKQRYQEAESDLKAVLALPADKTDLYALYQVYEALGLVYSETGNYKAAIENFATARTRLPLYSAALTTDMAIVLYQSGQKERALAELEGARIQARKELLPESKAVFLRLGMLYLELGRKDDARIALREFLTLTASMNTKDTLDERSQAIKMLADLK